MENCFGASGQVSGWITCTLYSIWLGVVADEMCSLKKSELCESQRMIVTTTTIINCQKY